MRARSVILTTMAALLANGLFPLCSSAEDKLDSKAIARWITQLGSRNFTEREKATVALVRIGPAARDQLEKAAESKDAEVRRRAEAILERIERDADTAALLLPKRVRLVYQDTSVIDAIADLTKKTGFAIQFEGDRTRLANRKITLDTGDVSFWEALDQFCRQAGLVERGPAPPKSQPPADDNLARAERRIFLARQRQLLMVQKGMDSAGANNPVAGPIVLVEGKADSLPRWHAGAVRIRALPANTPGLAQIKTQDETFITLDVVSEPKLAWQGIVDVRINKAMDQAGQALSQVPASGLPGSEALPGMTALALNGLIINGNAMMIDLDGEPVDLLRHQRQFPVRLKLGGKPSKALKELEGTVTAQVQTSHQPLITVENVLHSQGGKFKGPEGSYLKVLEVSRLDHGQVKLRIEVRPPPTGMNGMPMLGGQRVVFVQRFKGRAIAQLAIQEGENGGAQNLALQDAKGQAFQLANIDEMAAANGNSPNLEYQLVFQPRPGMAEPSKFVYSGRRLVTIEIPFTLKDVPLP